MGGAQSVETKNTTLESKVVETNNTITLESKVVETHLNKLGKLEEEISKMSDMNVNLRNELDNKTEQIDYLKKELQKHKQEMSKKDNVIREHAAMSRISQENVIKEQRKNDCLTNEVSRLALLVSDNNERLKQQNNEYQRNKDKDVKKYNKLQTEYSKLQSEFHQYKSLKFITNLYNLHQQMQKLRTQIDATKKKFRKEMNNGYHAANQNKIKNLSRDYDQLFNILKNANFLPSNEFQIMKQKYNEKRNENRRKTNEIMLRVVEIEEASKFLSNQLNMDISNNIKKSATIIENYIKAVFDLKQKSFVNDFRDEEVLYKDADTIGRNEIAMFRHITQSDGISNSFG